jgi:ribosomal protein S18 acetylase RimI-like enzyme
MRAEVRQAEPPDALRMSTRLREADLLEVKAHHLSPFSALWQGIKESRRCFTATLEGEPILIFGIVHAADEPKTGNIWLLGTDDIKKIGFQFLRESPAYIEEMSQGYDLLTNQVHMENELHIKWLKHLGMTFIAVRPPFLEFAKII